MLEEEKVVESNEIINETPGEAPISATPESNDKSKKEKKPKSKARRIIEWSLTILFAGLFVFLAVGHIQGMTQRNENYGETFTYGYGTFVIKTSSMEPDIPTGSAIVTHKDSPLEIINAFDKGEVVDITFYHNYPEKFIPDDPTLTQQVMPALDKGITVITHRLREYHIDESKTVGKGRYIFIVAGINKTSAEELGAEGQYQVLTEKQLLGVVKIKSNFLGGLFSFISSPWGLLIFLLIPALYLVFTSVLDIFKAIKEPEEVSEGGHKGGVDIAGLSEKDKERLKQEMLEEMMKKGDKK